MNKLFFALGVSALSPLALAKPTIVTSISPVSMIVAAIAGDKADIQQIVSSTASPHDFALRPSDLRKISNADAVVWVGESLENFLEKPLKNAGKEESSIEWLALKGVELHNFGEEGHDDHDEHDDHGHDEHDDHDHDEHDDHDHDGHDDHDHDEHEGHEGHSHEGVDPHVWLSPDNARVLAEAVTMRMVYLDSANAEYYKANLAAFDKGLSAKDDEIRHSFDKVSKVPYIVFHDAYTYFEEHYGLNNSGEVSVSPERKPGAKKVAELRHQIEENKIQCVFSEPQFSPGIVKALLDGTNVKTAVLDPLGSEIPLSKDAYFTFLSTLSGQFLSCLG
ncbi:zinc ABC transporter substrate-binding protein ZnuA [Marinomonas sp. 2405UD66-6]|uniref:zinc ABC transporter substrate-binding protein ZnuA n=1 Tax=Marinomonas sp. 2405UD66-6 TaxID=3391834 RepID=UPI0039C9496D